jgi:hypothetical protein
MPPMNEVMKNIYTLQLYEMYSELVRRDMSDFDNLDRIS